LTDAFWAARPVLQHTLILARARRVGPWVVLGNAMARAIATIPPNVALPAVVGGRMSLNFFAASVGPSGGGKGGADAASMAGLTFSGFSVDVVPIGSGEGVPRTFRPVGTKADEPNPVSAAVFTAPEIDSLTALSGRQGSTLSPELRKLYSGESLGFANAGKDTRNIVAAHSYRACLIAGVQPLRSGPLLGASDGGLMQRFVWLPTSDPDAPDDPPTDPGPWKVAVPAWERATQGHLRVVGSGVDLIIPDTARKAIVGHRLAVLREDPGVDPADGHMMLCRLKVAAALMALEGRTIIDEEDWRLSGYVMDVSAWTRERCRRALAEQSRSQNTARALATAERDEIVSDRKAQRARETILRKLANDRQQTGGELRRALKADIRDYYDAVLSDLLDRGEIGVSPGLRGNRKVHVYHRYTDRKPASNSQDDTCTQSTRVPTPLELAKTHTPRRRQRTRGKHRTSQQTEGEATA
jgi:hypothetical protein